LKKIRVLVVDDSAFARKVLRSILEAAPDIEVVGIARDGLDALTKIQELKPDVVTLDLVMPNLDGLGTLRALPALDPPRVVLVCMADATSDLALAALEAGAADLVQKPTPHASDRLYELGGDLLFKVRAASHVSQATHAGTSAVGSALTPAAVKPRSYTGNYDLLVIGASTGGPQAVTRILKALPADFPIPVGVVLHLPAGFTSSFAQRLSGECALPVTEGREGARLSRGHVAIAPGGLHMKLERDSRDFWLKVSREPASLHRPSVDQLFGSAAEAAPGRVLAVVLTGMGDDGLLGSRALHQGGSHVLVQNESSCVVYGMPRAVKEAKFFTGEHDIEEMASAILARV